MTEIKPTNSVYNDKTLLPYWGIQFTPNHEMQHWNIDIQYNQKDNNYIEGKLIFSSTDNPDEKIEFIFNENNNEFKILANVLDCNDELL